MTEALRAYQSNPNYLKTVAPDVSERIREYVNANPDVKSLGLAAAGDEDN